LGRGLAGNRGGRTGRGDVRFGGGRRGRAGGGDVRLGAFWRTHACSPDLARAYVWGESNVSAYREIWAKTTAEFPWPGLRGKRKAARGPPRGSACKLPTRRYRGRHGRGAGAVRGNVRALSEPAGSGDRVMVPMVRRLCLTLLAAASLGP